MMKTPFRKVRGLGLHKHGKGNRYAVQRSAAQLDELAQASQDMQDMRDCYDSLLSAAAGTANNAYEFSESLQEMGDCLLEKTALSDDEDSGRVLLMLGKVQFNIQKLIDNYRSHISQTITVPSESLLNELRIVEEMKKQCDEKRITYEAMKTQYEKGRMKNSKGENVSSRQLQLARDEFDEDATLFIFRMNSLKKGQSRSLLTQAARHYAAQMCLFRKALKALEAIEPHVKSTTEELHIDYHFSGLEDDDRDSVYLSDDEDDENDSDDYYDTIEDNKLNIDSHQKEVSSSENLMELDKQDLTFPRVPSVNSTKANIYSKSLWNSNTINRDLNKGSKSAPLSAETTFDPYEKYRQMRQSSTRKLNTYALPTPLENNTSVTLENKTKIQPVNNSIWHSMPLNHKTNENILKNESNNDNNNKPTPLPPPQTEVITRSALSVKKVKRYAFSGPLTSDLKSKPPLLSASGPISQPLTTSLSVSGLSLPKISELHELPRPPMKVASKKPYRVGFSAPLVTFKHGPVNGPVIGPDLVDTNKLPPDTAYTLPVPPKNEGNTLLASNQTKSWNLTDVGMVSPPLSPIPFRNIK